MFCLVLTGPFLRFAARLNLLALLGFVLFDAIEIAISKDIIRCLKWFGS